MKKIGLFSLVLIFALGGLGIGYAHWTETLHIEGDINTGYIDVNFMSQYDNDADDADDPSGPGNWFLPLPGVASPPFWDGPRVQKDVGETTSTFSTWDQQQIPGNISGNYAEIIITNGYPSYWGSVMWDIENAGNVPVGLWTVTLVWVQGPFGDPLPVNMLLEIGTRYYVDSDTGTVDTTLDEGDDYSFILSAHGTEQIDPVAWDSPPWNTRAYLDITVHIEQDAGQKSSYEFLIDYVFANWNEINGD
jgi:hypothetical protein